MQKLTKRENLAFSYGQTPVLNNISMTLEDGKIYGLLGENGVGKTTLLSLLAGLKKAKTGSIGIDGENPYSRRPDILGDQYFLTDELSSRMKHSQNDLKRGTMLFFVHSGRNTTTVVLDGD